MKGEFEAGRGVATCSDGKLVGGCSGQWMVTVTAVWSAYVAGANGPQCLSTGSNKRCRLPPEGLWRCAIECRGGTWGVELRCVMLDLCIRMTELL